MSMPRTALRRLTVLASLIFIVAGCAPVIHYDYSKEPDPRKREYVIGVADSLKVTVWKNAELSAEVKVRPDGTITLPLIGDLQAAGSTPGALKSEILKRLVDYVKDESAVVTIAVTDPNSYRFTVSGNVEHAGVYTSKYYVTVAEAVALAGGPNKFASTHEVMIIRTEADSSVRRIPIDYDRVSSGLHPDENLALFAGDTVFIP